MVGCTFTSNSAGNSGILQIRNLGSYQINNTIFTGNSGNAGAVGLISANANVLFHNCTMTGNSAQGGGALSMSGGALVTLIGCTLAGNTASGQGGDFNLGSASVVISRSTITGSRSPIGASILAISSAITISGSIFSALSATTGGISLTATPIVVSSSTFSGCVASDAGAAINTGSDLTVTGSVFVGNSAATGGAIATTNAANFLLTDSQFMNNQGFDGAAIYAPGATTLTASQCRFLGNTAQSTGGGMVTTFQTRVTLNGCNFTSNSALNGAAAYITGTSFVATSSYFTLNSALQSGGALYVTSAVQLVNSDVTDNSATVSGGGVALVGNTMAQFQGTSILRNTAPNGGGLACSHCALSLTTSSLRLNSATSSGAGLYCDPSAPSTQFTVDGATTFSGNVAGDEPLLEAQCEACGCCHYAEPATLATRCATLPGRACAYMCEDGYNVTFPSGALCPANGILPMDSICPAIACRNLSEPMGTHVSYTSTPIETGVNATYTCDLAFRLVNPDPLRCVGPDWLGDQPSCISRPCNTLQPPAHGSFTIESYEVATGEVAYYTCEQGYALSYGATNRRVCNYPDWAGSDPTCDAQPCAAKSPVAPLLIDSTLPARTGDSRTYSCQTGYQFAYGDSQQLCVGPTWMISGTLTPALDPFCEPRRCPARAATLSNGAVTLSPQLVFGAVANYSCDPGYQMLNGAAFSSCVVDSATDEMEWTDVPPTCEAVTCDTLESPFELSCNEPYQYQDSCTAGCKAGYAGISLPTYSCVQPALNGPAAWYLGPQPAYRPTCTGCILGTYAEAFSNQERCTACVNSNTLDVLAKNKSACYCDPGFYEANPVTDPGECSGCVPGGLCKGGKATPVAAPGYYYYYDPGKQAPFILPCNPSDLCLGENNCATGSTGYLCGDCLKHFYKLNGYCHPCPNQALLIVILGVIAAVVGVTVLIFSARPGPYSEHHFGQSSIPMALAFVQIAASFFSFKLPWPPNTRRTFDVLSFSNLNLQLFSPECVASDISFLSVTTATLAIPLILLGVFVLVGTAWLGFLYIRHRATFVRQWRLPVANLVAGFLNFMCLAYLLLARASLEIFNCATQADGRVTVRLSPTVDCYTPEWWAVAKFAVFGLVVYIFGVPLTLFAMYRVYNPGASAVDDPLFSFYAGRYRVETWYYELIVMARKLVIVVFAVFIGNAGIVQAVVTCLLLFLSCILTLILKPFTWSKHNMLEVTTLSGLVIIIFGGLLMTFTSFRAVATADALIIAVVVIEALVILTVAVAELVAKARLRGLKKEHPLKARSVGTAAGKVTHVARIGDIVLALADGSVKAWQENGEKEYQALSSSLGGVTFLGELSGALLLGNSSHDLILAITRATETALVVEPIARNTGLDATHTATLSAHRLVVAHGGRSVSILHMPAHAKGASVTEEQSTPSSSSETPYHSASASRGWRSTLSSSSRKPRGRVQDSSTLSEQESSSASSSESRSSVSVVHDNLPSLDIVTTASIAGSMAEGAIVALACRRNTIFAALPHAVVSWVVDSKHQMTVDCHWSIGSAFEATSLAVSNAGLFVGLTDGTIVQLDFASPRVVRSVRAHPREITSLQVVSCGGGNAPYLISASHDARVKIWNAYTLGYEQTVLRFRSTVAAAHAHSGDVVAVAKDGAVMAAKINVVWSVSNTRQDCFARPTAYCRSLCAGLFVSPTFSLRNPSGSHSLDSEEAHLPLVEYARGEDPLVLSKLVAALDHLGHEQH